MHRQIAIIRLIACCLGGGSGGILLASSGARAQAPDYLSALAVPPPRVGTCLPLPSHTDSSGATISGHHLVIVSQPPGARREVIVFANARGEPLQYAELTTGFEPPAQGTGTDVLASIDSRGVVRGVLTVRRMAMTPPAAGPRIDRAAPGAMPESARSSSTRIALSAAQRAQVARMARWLVRRCP
jgi:hypothetical protein